MCHDGSDFGRIIAHGKQATTDKEIAFLQSKGIGGRTIEDRQAKGPCKLGIVGDQTGKDAFQTGLNGAILVAAAKGDQQPVTLAEKRTDSAVGRACWNGRRRGRRAACTG